jgi:hypothetical protein
MPIPDPDSYVLTLTRLEARMLKALVEFALEDPRAEFLIFPYRVNNLAVQRVRTKLDKLKYT